MIAMWRCALETNDHKHFHSNLNRLKQTNKQNSKLPACEDVR